MASSPRSTASTWYPLSARPSTITSRRPGSSSATRIRMASASHGRGRVAVPSGGAPLDRSRRGPGKAQRQDGTDRHRSAGVVEELVRDTPRGDDRVAPVVELDELGQQLRAHPEAVAGDAVDDELGPPRAGGGRLTGPGEPTRPEGRSHLRPPGRGRPW